MHLSVFQFVCLLSIIYLPIKHLLSTLSLLSTSHLSTNHLSLYLLLYIYLSIYHLFTNHFIMYQSSVNYYLLINQ